MQSRNIPVIVSGMYIKRSKNRGKQPAVVFVLNKTQEDKCTHKKPKRNKPNRAIFYCFFCLFTAAPKFRSDKSKLVHGSRKFQGAQLHYK